MGQTYRAVYRIRKIERNAVGIKSRQDDAGLIGNETVDVEPVKRTNDPAAAIRPADPQDIGRVGLVRVYDVFRPETDGIGEKFEVLNNIFKASVFPGLLVCERMPYI
jgi:hypothetical protein